MGRASKPGDPAADSREDFLARWSRRKLDARHDAPEVPGDTAVAVTPSGTPAVEPERELTDADMPPIETLDADSDYAAFLSPGVSDDLRQQALRKLFSQPDFNITDGLNDYDEDYTQFAGLGNVITHEMKRMPVVRKDRGVENGSRSDKKAARRSAVSSASRPSKE